MMGQAIEQSRRHLRITEHARPFAKGEIGRHDHRGPLVEPADQMEQKLSASLGERQVAELIKDDEVEAGEIIGEPPLPVLSALAPTSIAGSMKDKFFSSGLQHAQNRCGAAKEVEPAVVGGDLLIGS